MKRAMQHMMLLLLITVTVSFSATASVFSAMGAGEVSALLDRRAADMAVPAATTAKGSAAGTTAAVTVNARDMVGKVFGIIEDGRTGRRCVDGAREALSMTPSLEGSTLWLDSADGYRLLYEGMSPDVAAMAHIADNDSIDEYCYFFLFPYTGSGKAAANSDQAGFSGTLLQELHDITADIGAVADTPDLFFVNGRVDNNMVDVRLLDDADRYILMLIVSPDAYSPADDSPATDATAQL